MATHCRESGDLVPNLLKKHSNLVERKTVICVRVVELEQLFDLVKLRFGQRNLLLDSLDHDLPFVKVDLSILVFVSFVHQV